MTDNTPPTTTRTLPGDPVGHALIDRIVRVDHAGEYGAMRIYDGQLAVLGDKSEAGAAIARMRDQEREHLDWFEAAVPRYRARPTVLHPLWHVGGFMLGAATAALGPRAAMACTVAVEEVIDEHYAKQTRQLGDSQPELSAKIEQFRAEELEHRDTGLAHEAERAPAYPVLRAAVKSACRLAIFLSERV
jgi:ubiquinone biosynthesis monooxygenase Coq7